MSAATATQPRRTSTGTPARLPDEQGSVDREGVSIHWESFGQGPRTVLLLPTWSIVSSRAWKAQVPYLARRMRVVLFDPRGNGLSDRPLDPAAYRYEEHVADALAVLDAAEVARAAVVGWSLGGRYALVLAAEHPERVDRAVFVAPTVGFATLPRDIDFEADWPDDEGWHRYNRRSWLRDYRGFLEYFFSQVYSEPHSTKQIDDSVAFGLDTSAETLVATMVGGTSPDNRALARRVRCPVLVMHGDDDHIVAYQNGVELAEETGGALVTFSGSGHGPPLRDPVAANLILGEFLAPSSPEPTYVRAPVRTRRALFVSSPIGLGHARRDLALARELRRLVPGLEIDWLAQPPVTRLLESTEERIHPASAELAGENAHISAEAGEHELHVFEAFRRMDEILLANFMLFDEVAAEGRYDLWIGDEAWELDHYLHENPERKRAAYVWLTDFVGWVPLPENGEREPLLTADYNAEMLEHVARYPRVRDLALFFGDQEDVAPVGFGPGLPAVRDWMAAHYDFVGYETGLAEGGIDRNAARARLGWGPDERVCVVSVGGSGCGAQLLAKAVAAAAPLRRLVPGMRMVCVCGPSIDPGSLEPAEGVELLGHIDDMPALLAAGDVALVQGGLATTMELVAAGRPFVAVPLARHFEQRVHVRHRLDRLGATRWIEYRDAGPEALAAAVAEALRAPVRYTPLNGGGARRAAERIAALA
jgi:pimeloyl-ACP methyl ester carboxylesterase/predicted glycosyltransferase